MVDLEEGIVLVLFNKLAYQSLVKQKQQCDDRADQVDQTKGFSKHAVT